MYRTVIKINGMACGMCEAHINDAIRNAFPVKKVSSSHIKGECVIISEEKPNDEELKKTIEKTGYTVTDISEEPYEKNTVIFGFFKKNKNKN